MNESGTGLRGYESYKDSGVEWLGAVPSHWDVKPGLTCFKENKDRNNSLLEKTILSLSYGRIIIKPDKKMTGLVPASFENYQLIRPGDIVIRTTDLQNDQTSLRVGLAKDKGMITSAYLGLRCVQSINPAFIYRLLEGYDAQKIFYGMGSGLRQNIDFQDFKRMPILLPPRSEQDRIAQFLDEKTAEIDAVIAKKERLIELLQEQKRILIHRAVTRGMDPDASLKDSGVEWIGSIPAHWETKKAKYLLHQTKSPVKKEHNIVTAFRDGQVTLRSNRRTEGYTFAILEQGYQAVRPGQLVINSMDAFAGAIGVSDSEGKCSPEYVVCDSVNSDDMDLHFAALLLRQMALSGYIEVICSAVRQRALRIRFNDLAPLTLIIPPIDEQKAIVNMVDGLEVSFKTIVEKTREELKGVSDYRNILISSVVTGKIKV